MINPIRFTEKRIRLQYGEEGANRNSTLIGFTGQGYGKERTDRPVPVSVHSGPETVLTPAGYKLVATIMGGFIGVLTYLAIAHF